ncbi:MAG TPA: extracellular solute-binding protein [Candidatus Saccharimonadales bacterium]|nr:extracellular solute-binding protein [Candidatus Saccharimonadales bacterium]
MRPSRRHPLFALTLVAAFTFAACGGGGSSAAPDGSAAPTTGASPAASADAGGSPAASTGFDPQSVSGSVVVSGWQASPEEGAILEQLFADFQTAYPNIEVDYQPVADDYPAAMTAKFSSGEPPDLFYVDSSVAPEWIDQGVLEDLEPLAAERGFDTSQFFEGYLDAFKGTEGGIYGFPKDGNTLALAYNTEMLEAAGVTPPTTWAELTAAAEALTTSDQQAFCLNNSLDRALAFIYQNGGSLLSEDKTANEFDSPQTQEALKTYLGWFKAGQGARAADLGDDWCGKALGEKQVAMIFEGGWLDPYMKTNYPDVSYAWAPMPAGAEQATLGFTVSYSIGVDSVNKDAAWVLLTYLTGKDGMTTWTEGGVANPSRKDVTAAAGKEVLVEGAAVAQPWSFIPGFSGINDAFNNAMTAQIEAKSDDPAPVISATSSAIDSALAGQ